MFLLSIAEAVAHNARRKPDHPALEQGGRVFSYAELDRRVRQIAHRLHAAGLTEGDIVGLSLPDTIDHMAIMIGVLRMGAIVLPMDVRWTDEEKRRVATFFGAKRIITSDAPINDFNTLVTDAAWDAAVEAADPGGSFPDDLDAPIFLSLSSGTTGMPKGPLVTHRHMTMRFMGQCVTLGVQRKRQKAVGDAALLRRWPLFHALRAVFRRDDGVLPAAVSAQGLDRDGEQGKRHHPVSRPHAFAPSAHAVRTR